MRLLFIIYFLLLFFHNKVSAHSNVTKDTLFKVVEINDFLRHRAMTLYEKNAIIIWDSYLYKRKENRQFSDWSQKDRKMFKYPDIYYRFSDYNFESNINEYYKPIILSISTIDSSCLIKTAFYSINCNTNKLSLASIMNIWVVWENGKRVLQSALYKNLQTYDFYKYATVELYTPPLFNNPKNIAIKLDSVNKIIAQKYKILPENIKYFHNNSIKDYLQLIGYDYERSMFHTNLNNKYKEGAISDINNVVIYNGTPDILENATHEMCHLCTHKVFGEGFYQRTYHNFINEGAATFLGGTAGENILNLLASLNEDISKNKYKYNFSNLLDDEVGVGKEDAHLSYVVGGLICKLAYDKAGMDGIFKLLQGGWQDEDLYRTVESVLGVKRENLDSFIRNELKKYAR